MGRNQPSIRAIARCQCFEHILTVGEAALPRGRGSKKSAKKPSRKANFYRPPGPPCSWDFNSQIRGQECSPQNLKIIARRWTDATSDAQFCGAEEDA